MEKVCGYRKYRDCHIVTSMNRGGGKIQKSRARMLMQSKVSMHIESACLLSGVNNQDGLKR